MMMMMMMMMPECPHVAQDEELDLMEGEWGEGGVRPAATVSFTSLSHLNTICDNDDEYSRLDQHYQHHTWLRSHVTSGDHLIVCMSAPLYTQQLLQSSPPLAAAAATATAAAAAAAAAAPHPILSCPSTSSFHHSSSSSSSSPSSSISRVCCCMMSLLQSGACFRAGKMRLLLFVRGVYG